MPDFLHRAADSRIHKPASPAPYATATIPHDIPQVRRR